MGTDNWMHLAFSICIYQIQIRVATQTCNYVAMGHRQALKVMKSLKECVCEIKLGGWVEAEDFHFRVPLF